jgi:hypothetical protein
MPTWMPVSNSTRVSAIAYDPAGERIMVRFLKDGTEWQYGECSQSVWDAFSATGVSKGRFIAAILDHHPHGPLML